MHRRQWRVVAFGMCFCVVVHSSGGMAERRQQILEGAGPSAPAASPGGDNGARDPPPTSGRAGAFAWWSRPQITRPIPPGFAAVILSQIVLPIWRVRAWRKPVMYLNAMVRELCNEIMQRGGFTRQDSETVVARFHDAAASRRVRCTFLSPASRTEYSEPGHRDSNQSGSDDSAPGGSDPASESYSFVLSLSWLPHRTMREKLRHELAHHFVAIEFKRCTGRDVFLEERSGCLPVEDALDIEGRVRKISDPTDPVRKAICKVEWCSLVAAYWLAEHRVVAAIVATAVVGAAVVALVALW